VLLKPIFLGTGGRLTVFLSGSRRIGRRLLLTAGAAIGIGVHVAKAYAAESPDADAMQAVKTWPAAAQQAADEMRRKYGPPKEVSATMLVWYDNAPWTRTIVYRNPVAHDFPSPHEDVLEQSVKYKEPLNFYNALAVYNGSVLPDRTRGEVTSRSASEATNILALNLAHDIVHGARTAEQAREIHTQAVRDLMAGKTPELAQKLLFGPPQGETADPDIATITPPAGTTPSTAGPVRIR
jgi:hypothetical protein